MEVKRIFRDHGPSLVPRAVCPHKAILSLGTAAGMQVIVGNCVRQWQGVRRGVEFQRRGMGFYQVLEKCKVPWSGSDRLCSGFILTITL